jgi:hypothetical protein
MSDQPHEPIRPSAAAVAGSQVTTFLHEVLADGSVAVAGLEQRARAAGLLGGRQKITDSKPFKTAKAKLNIVSRRRGFGRDGVWYWSLPAQPPGKSDTNAKAEVSMPEMGTGKVAYGEDHSRPAVVHSLPTATVGETPLNPNIPVEWMQGAGRLQHLPLHAGVPVYRWRVFLNDVGHFLCGHWAGRAADFGWGVMALFGCHPDRPLDHLQGAGLLWRVGGGKIVGMYSDWAVIEINGAQRIIHRRPSPANFVLPWRRRAP